MLIDTEADCPVKQHAQPLQQRQPSKNHPFKAMLRTALTGAEVDCPVKQHAQPLQQGQPLENHSFKAVLRTAPTGTGMGNTFIVSYRVFKELYRVYRRTFL
jgi:hypothetical protein